MKGGVKMRNERLIKARQDKGLNQTELSKLLGFKGKQSVANWENGHSVPTLTTALMIADILEKDIVFLFGHYVQDSHTNEGVS